jgi:hypothetical protein
MAFGEADCVSRWNVLPREYLVSPPIHSFFYFDQLYIQHSSLLSLPASQPLLPRHPSPLSSMIVATAKGISKTARSSEVIRKPFAVSCLSVPPEKVLCLSMWSVITTGQAEISTALRPAAEGDPAWAF